MNKLSTFQLIVITIFGLFILLALVLFATYNTSKTGQLSEMTLWGTLPAQDVNAAIDTYNLAYDEKIKVTYTEKKAETFDRDFVEALANNKAPDAILLPQDLILRHQNKVFEIPYSSLTERQIRDAFVDEAMLFTTPIGSLGIPFVVDPLVMYWNRDLLQAAGFTTPPKYWEEFITLTQALTKKNSSNVIEQSAVAFGGYANVNNAKDIISALVGQAGGQIVTQVGGQVASAFDARVGNNPAPAEAVVRFYTDFANPLKVTYSWNRAMPIAQNAFLAGDLALYFGKASEYKEIQAKNPNLPFDVTTIPQPKTANTKSTFGRLYAISLVKTGANLENAFNVAIILSGKNFMTSWLTVSDIPPARRDLLSQFANNAVKETFYTSALVARGWLDPEPNESSQIFDRMITEVTAGREQVSEAVRDASLGLNQLIIKTLTQ